MTARPGHIVVVLLAVAMAIWGVLGPSPQARAAEPGVPGAFVSLDPARVLDTRVGNGAPQSAVLPYGALSLQISGRGGVPASGVAAVAVNVTATGPSSSGFLTVYPAGSPQPTASNLNFDAGQTIPNLVTVKVGGDGRIVLTNNSPGTVQLIADVAGYYLSGQATEPGTFVSTEPTRVLDTRVGNGAPAAAVAPFGTVGVQVTGRGSVPPSGATAVVMNVTVTGSSSSGFVTAYPSGTDQPTASNLNFSSRQSIPNLVTVKLGDDGRVNLTSNSTGTVHLIADVAGYYLSGTASLPGAFVSLAPSRLLDTRAGVGAASSAVAPFGTVGLQVNGRGSVPPAGVSAIVANVTVTGPGAVGFITVFPSSAAQPSASNLNFVGGQTVPNLVAVKVGSDGKIAPTNNSAGSVHLIADVAGYFLGDPAQPGYAAAAQLIAHDLPSASAAGAAGALNQLLVTAPGSMAGYSRTLFPHWRDATNNGWPAIPNSNCDVRQASLYREGTGVSHTAACDILSGAWFDPYTATSLYAPAEVDIDHVVPLAEAWRSGAASWGSAQLTAFANDRLVVLAVDDATNQSKGDKGPDTWKPPNQAAHCLYAKRWIAIKVHYQLTVDESEKGALSQMLGTCQS